MKSLLRALRNKSTFLVHTIPLTLRDIVRWVGGFVHRAALTPAPARARQTAQVGLSSGIVQKNDGLDQNDIAK